MPAKAPSLAATASLSRVWAAKRERRRIARQRPGPDFPTNLDRATPAHSPRHRRALGHGIAAAKHGPMVWSPNSVLGNSDAVARLVGQFVKCACDRYVVSWRRVEAAQRRRELRQRTGRPLSAFDQ
jgi:hypothetical protein